MGNLCFEKDPQRIADILYGANGITQDDIHCALIGACRIITDLEKRIETLERKEKENV